MSGRLFVIDGLASIAGALTHIEYGDTAAKLDHTYPVRVESQGTGMHLAYGIPEESRNRSLLFRYKPFDSEEDAGRVFRVYDGVSLAPVLVPPIWSHIHFRGRFSDETVTPIQGTANESVFLGFVARLVKVNSGNIELPVFVFATSESGLESSLETTSFPLEDWFRFSNNTRNPLGNKFRGGPKANSSLDDLFNMAPHRWPLKVELFTLLSPGIKTIKYYQTERLRDELRKISPGTFYASFLDGNGRRIGSCEYHIDRKKLEFIVGQVENLPR